MHVDQVMSIVGQAQSPKSAIHHQSWLRGLLLHEKPLPLHTRSLGTKSTYCVYNDLITRNGMCIQGIIEICVLYHSVAHFLSKKPP